MAKKKKTDEDCPYVAKYTDNFAFGPVNELPTFTEPVECWYYDDCGTCGVKLYGFKVGPVFEGGNRKANCEAFATSIRQQISDHKSDNEYKGYTRIQ